MPINTTEDLARQIDAAANPTLSNAEIEVGKDPTQINVPRLKYSDATRAAIDAHEQSWGLWAVENTALADAIENYRSAIASDDIAIRKAASAGAKVNPGRSATTKALDDLEWATAKCKAAREACSKLARIGDLIEAGLDNYLDQIHERVEVAKMILSATIETARVAYADAAREAIDAQSALDYFADMVHRRYGIRYSTEHGDGIPSIRWPQPYEVAMPWASNTLAAIDATRGGTKTPTSAD